MHSGLWRVLSVCKGRGFGGRYGPSWAWLHVLTMVVTGGLPILGGNIAASIGDVMPRCPLSWDMQGRTRIAAPFAYGYHKPTHHVIRTGHMRGCPHL